MSGPGLTGLAADQAFNARVKMVLLDLADPSLVFHGVNFNRSFSHLNASHSTAARAC